MKIGFFDSGLGGLTIMDAVIKELPQYDYEFYGDTANLPYGDKSEEEIFNLTKRGIEHLFQKDCLLIIVACNTASAETLRKLQTEYLPQNYPDRRILGVIIPTIEVLLEEKIERAILIGTNRTVESKKYHLELDKYSDAPKLNSIATPALVPLIEAQKYDEAYKIICEIIDNKESEEAIILGCTHYTTLSAKLNERYAENKFKIISQDKIIPNKLKIYLSKHPELEERLSRNFKRNIYLSKHT
ncbi:MAG: glutamate racemase, partial [Bdellovibrionales bacterium]